MQFAAIDVETANADLASICQIGVAIFRDGAHVDSWSSLVDPEDEFDGFNISIHGIDEQAVRGAPTWPVVAETLRSLEDARAAGEVLCKTSAHAGLSLDNWFARVQRPISPALDVMTQ